MNKNTRIRDADKKQPFLYGQIKKFDSRMVSWIKTPNSHFGENNIPNDKKKGSNNNCRKDGFPTSYVLHPFFETIKKRNYEGGNI